MLYSYSFVHFIAKANGQQKSRLSLHCAVRVKFRYQDPGAGQNCGVEFLKNSIFFRIFGPINCSVSRISPATLGRSTSAMMEVTPKQLVCPFGRNWKFLDVSCLNLSQKMWLIDEVVYHGVTKAFLTNRYSLSKSYHPQWLVDIRMEGVWESVLVDLQHSIRQNFGSWNLL